MSYLLFLDESGHDHRNAPYEVRGGFALHDQKLWPFVLDLRDLELHCFGARLHEFGTEIKGHKLLDKDRFKWASQSPWLDEVERCEQALGFLKKGAQKPAAAPTRREFTAYGQASLLMARGIFDLLPKHGGIVFAVAIHRGAAKPPTAEDGEFLRRDHVFLLERFFYFLEDRNENGLIVMDETQRAEDRRFVRRLERYFLNTEKGRHRSSRVIPSPFFVSSEMTYPVQAADVCIYCVNHGFRLPGRGMNEPVRPEIAAEFGARLSHLQFKGERNVGGESFESFGIAYERSPYGPREAR